MHYHPPLLRSVDQIASHNNTFSIPFPDTGMLCGVCLSGNLDEGAHEVQVCSIRDQVRVCTVIGK